MGMNADFKTPENANKFKEKNGLADFDLKESEGGDYFLENGTGQQYAYGSTAGGFSEKGIDSKASLEGSLLGVQDNLSSPSIGNGNHASMDERGGFIVASEHARGKQYGNLKSSSDARYVTPPGESLKYHANFIPKENFKSSNSKYLVPYNINPYNDQPLAGVVGVHPPGGVGFVTTLVSKNSDTITHITYDLDTLEVNVTTLMKDEGKNIKIKGRVKDPR